MMATFEDVRFFCAAYMHRLTITDCPNVSAAALRRFVKARLQADGVRTYSTINELCVSGFAPNISIEDQQQISQHVYGFKYYPSSS
jgi:hypothetical protein